MLRPASAGFRRLFNAVIAALFNIVIFGSGAAIYLFAVDLIMNTPTLPGWLQVVLVGLSGVVGWLLLRPYRRITQLGGGVSAAAALAATSSKRPNDAQTPAAAGGGAETIAAGRPPQRVELRSDPAADRPVEPPPDPTPGVPRRRMPAPAGGGWSEPESTLDQPNYAIYRPRRSEVTTVHEVPTTAGARAEARRET